MFTFFRFACGDTHPVPADHAGHESRAPGGREDGSYQIDSWGCVLWQGVLDWTFQGRRHPEARPLFKRNHGRQIATAEQT